MDYAQHEKMIELGYDKTIVNNNPWMTKQEVQEWYEKSCSLRFIDAVFSDGESDKFFTVIPQFFGDDEDE
jgi:hypothetical protein